MARISLLFCLVTLFALANIINNASATDDRQVEPTKKILKDAGVAEEMFKELKKKEENVKGLEPEMKFLSKSKPILDDLFKNHLNGKANHHHDQKDLVMFRDKLSRFYNVWRTKASDAVVPQKERKYADLIEKILKYTDDEPKLQH